MKEKWKNSHQIKKLLYMKGTKDKKKIILNNYFDIKENDGAGSETWTHTVISTKGF